MHVFISYSHADHEIAQKIVDVLVECGIEHFLDRKDVEWGSSITSEIQGGLDRATHLLVILSPASLRSQWVAFEIGAAFSSGKTVLPYLTHPALQTPSFLNGISFLQDLDNLTTYFNRKSKILHDVPKGSQKDSLSVAKPSNPHDREVQYELEKMLERVHGPAEKRILKAIDTIYRLKKTQRVGWTVRGVNEVESVADHIYMACLLAEIFLPERVDELPDYEKSRVVRLLLMGGIEEAVSGDILPSERSESWVHQTRKGVEELHELLLFPMDLRATAIADTINELEASVTINATIAKDIQKLETYIQLHIYSSFYTMNDFHAFKDALENRIYTGPVREIFRRVARAFGKDTKDK
jgi:putative hydrolase of HD superfamily